MEVATQKILLTASAISPDDYLNKIDFQSQIWKKVFEKANEMDASDIHVEQFFHVALTPRVRPDSETR